MGMTQCASKCRRERRRRRERQGGGGGGGGSRDKNDAIHYDPKAQRLLIKVSFIRLI